MRPRLALVLLPLVLTGCLAAPVASEEWVAPPGPRFERGGPIGSAGVFVPAHDENVSLPPPPRKSVGNDSVPATDAAGQLVPVAVAAVRETMPSRNGAPSYRYACGGAVVAVAPGEDDPRGHESAYSYVHSTRVVGPDNTTWVTDVYARDAGNGTRALVWVANVGGGETFRADDGSAACAPAAHANVTYNAMLHVEGLDEVEIFFAPAQRFAVPERTFLDAVSA